MPETNSHTNNMEYALRARIGEIALPAAGGEPFLNLMNYSGTIVA